MMITNIEQNIGRYLARRQNGARAERRPQTGQAAAIVAARALRLRVETVTALAAARLGHCRRQVRLHIVEILAMIEILR